MGYMTCFSGCFGCGRVFGYNPHYVPSIKGEAICGDCIDRANVKRAEMGLEPHVIHPLAYEPEEVA